MNFLPKSHLSTSILPLERVMIITPDYLPEPWSGLGTHVSELATGIGEQGYQVNVVAYSPHKVSTYQHLNVTVHFVSSSEASTKPLTTHWFHSMNESLISQSRYLIDECHWRPDVVHCHDWLSFPAAYVIGKLYNIPIVGTVHLLQAEERRLGEQPNIDTEMQAEITKQERALCTKTDGLITVSMFMKGPIHETYGVPKEKIHVVYNGIDPQVFSRQALPPEEFSSFRKTIAAPNEKIIIFVGRLDQRKGIFPLLASAIPVIEAHPNARYLLIGGPPMGNSIAGFQKVLHARQQHPDLQKRTKMLGKIPRAQLSTLYQIADIAVVPSLYEPFGLAAVEAMAAGVPVVATDVGGLREIIQHGQTGLLVHVGGNAEGMPTIDVRQLAEAQSLLLTNTRMATQLGKAGQQDVTSRFSRKSMTLSTIKVYQQTISNFQGNK